MKKQETLASYCMELIIRLSTKTDSHVNREAIVTLMDLYNRFSGHDLPSVGGDE